jgi:hypothetical protein
MKLINLEHKKKESEVNALARQRIQELLDNIGEEDIFGLVVIVTTETSTNDFYMRSEGQNAFALIGAVECLKRDMMRGMIESRHKYVEE